MSFAIQNLDRTGQGDIGPYRDWETGIAGGKRGE